MYCILGRCTVCLGGVLCGRSVYVLAVYCEVGQCIVCLDGVLCGRSGQCAL